jgi:hypothetical protein
VVCPVNIVVLIPPWLIIPYNLGFVF